MSTTALVLNVLVAGAATITFARAGHLSLSLVVPFAMTSIPLAFLGALIKLPGHAYHLLLGLVLLWAAGRLALPERASTVEASVYQPPGRAIAGAVGGGIGLLSGIVGVGGGIFLTPLLLLKRWAPAKQAAAASAIFIVLNSVAGLIGRLAKGNVSIAVEPQWLLMVGVAFAGGLLGASAGATRYSTVTLRRVLSVVLLLASGKLIYVSVLG